MCCGRPSLHPPRLQGNAEFPHVRLKYPAAPSHRLCAVFLAGLGVGEVEEGPSLGSSSPWQSLERPRGSATLSLAV